jgi:cytoskeletal protein RodZ
LAQARHREGLTVAEVSARTFIREALIRAIERDEFGGCGGEFYVRGHINAIAAAVGADPGPLISEYEAAHPAGGPGTLDDLLYVPSPPSPLSQRPPVPPRRRRRRRQSSWLLPLAMVLCLAAVGFVAIRLTTGGGNQPSAASRTPAARTPVASGGSRPNSHQAPAASLASPPAQTTELTPVTAVAFGPRGTSDGDNAQHASRALSGNQAMPWHTDWYTTAKFGNLQAGTGLLLDLGQTVVATSVTIQLGSTPGSDLQVRAGTSSTDLSVVASATDAGGTVRLPLTGQPDIRYLLIWFTLLPPDAAGTYQAYISSVTVSARY